MLENFYKEVQKLPEEEQEFIYNHKWFNQRYKDIEDEEYLGGYLDIADLSDSDIAFLLKYKKLFRVKDNQLQEIQDELDYRAGRKERPESVDLSKLDLGWLEEK